MTWGLSLTHRYVGVVRLANPIFTFEEWKKAAPICGGIGYSISFQVVVGGGGGSSLKVANWFWLALLQENLDHLGSFCWSIIFSSYKVKWQISSGHLEKISSIYLLWSWHPRKSFPECSNLDRGNNPTAKIDAAGKLYFLSSWKFSIRESFEILMFYSIFSLTKYHFFLILFVKKHLGLFSSQICHFLIELKIRLNFVYLKSPFSIFSDQVYLA